MAKFYITIRVESEKNTDHSIKLTSLVEADDVQNAVLKLAKELPKELE